ncbi:MAG: alpha/beta fold hydrolase [Polaromonas sp.]
MTDSIAESRTTPTLVKPLTLAGGPHGVLLFHGLSSGPLELQFVARGLHRAGYTVHAPVIPGYTYGLIRDHGVDHGAEDWICAALRELDWLAEQCESVSVGGLCIGAILALRVAALRSGRLSSVLALSTALHFDGWGNPWYTPLLNLARYLPFAKRISIREREPYGLKDPRMRAWVKRQMETAGQSTAGAASLRVRDLLKSRDLIAITRKSLQEIKCDTLLIHAKEDECASTRSSFEVADRVNSSRIHLVILSDSYHMISIDQEKDLVIREMIRFLSDGEALAGVTARPALAPEKR